jgi:hypothetical protein
MLVQPSNSGGFTGASGSATLPTGTTAGSTLLLAISSTGTSVTVTGFTDDSPTNIGTTKAYAFRKSNVAAAETSWTITAVSGSINRWTVYEVDGLDPVAPVDVKQTGTTPNVTSGTSVSTGTLAASTTYDGLVVALHAANNAASPTAPTFSGHTNALVEMDEGGATNGTASVGLSVSMRTVQSLGAFECTATASITLTGTNTATALIVCYSAAGAKREASIAFFWGMKVGTGAAGLGIGAVGSRYFETVTGSPAMTADGLQVSATAAAENVISPLISTGTQVVRTAVDRIPLRFDSALPGADLDLVVVAGNVSNGTATLRYRSASQKLGLTVTTGGAEVLSDATVTAGSFIAVDLRMIANGTAYTVDWQVDYGAGPVAQTQATGTGSSAFGSTTLQLGWAGASTGTVTYAYAVRSIIAGHYPLGEFEVNLLKVDPAGTVTISGTTGNFGVMTANGTIGAWNAANALAAVDDWPPTVGASADGAVAVTAHATDYIEFPMETDQAAPSGSIRAVRVLVPMWAASATTATCRVLGYDGTTATTLFAEADPEADNTSTPAWICKMWRPTGGWTQAKLDAAAIRFGSNDATPDIGPHAVGMEVAVQVAAVEPVFGDPATGDVLVEAKVDPATGGKLSLDVTTPPQTGGTLRWEVAGTPDSVAVPAGSTHTEVLDAADVTVVNRVEFEADPTPEQY